MSVEQIEINGQACALTIQYDITELKRAEREVRRLNDDLKQRQVALEAVNKELEAFSYSVSHDLRAPLRAIDGFSQALAEDFADRLDGDGKDYINRIRNGSQRMGELIDDLLELSRLTRSDMRREPIDLSAMARRIAAELREQYPERKVAFEVEDGLVVEGDARLLRAALSNLLSNAWKYTGKQTEPHVEFGATNHNGRRAYFVRDNGAGFDMTYADKLFGVFQRLHRTSDFPGNGVGLATVQRIIHRHGGEIWAEAAVNCGATFYFSL
jgi:light-regulated signal transduction histidine kinase (bacteriophytochrome)